ncbi:hypothetical protein K470DRAFT_261363 [Piedraia hortae CBS 480.64]|uniref:RanBD1 domain-containing protein n=1 Tax=Piedraia hortae CBS 480.64 TaxID=1314780 RepID=A0A6A7CAD5_9PEZI|nr:hypothetical protein K470DRAFT_261363 [Piedraia hortae CBS 480.64]
MVDTRSKSSDVGDKAKPKHKAEKETKKGTKADTGERMRNPTEAAAATARSSDSDMTPEKPVRERLKKATIDTPARDKTLTPDAAGTGKENQRVQRQHTRKRSREISSAVDKWELKKTKPDTEADAVAGTLMEAPDASPTVKRSRIHSSTAEGGAEDDGEDNSGDYGEKKTEDDEGDKAEDGGEAVGKKSNETEEAKQTAQPKDAAETEAEVKSKDTSKSKDAGGSENVLEPKDAKPEEAAEPKEAESKEPKEPKDADPKGVEPKDAEPKDSKPKDAAEAKDADSEESTKPKDTKSNDTKLRETKPEAKQTSADAFARSGFSALAKSSTSGFGALGQQASSIPAFGSAAAANTTPSTGSSNGIFGGALGAKSSFGGALGAKSSFGNASFGASFGASPFAAVGGSNTTPLTSFASPSAASPWKSTSTVKPLGATASPAAGKPDNEKADDNEDNETDRKGTDSGDKQDARFNPLNATETGEEGEETIFTCRAKLYAFVKPDTEQQKQESTNGGKAEWRERGVGTLRLNMTYPPEEEDKVDDAKEEGEKDPTEEKQSETEEKPSQENQPSKTTARFVLRADGSHRLVLNTPIKKELMYGTPSGGKPQGGSFFLMGTLDASTGKLEMLQLKMKPDFAEQLYNLVRQVQTEL